MQSPPPPSQSPSPSPAPLTQQGFDYIPMPPWVRGFAVLTLAIFFLALLRTPRVLSQGVQYRRGQIALANGDPAKAVALLQPISDAYPQDLDARIDLIEALMVDHNYEQAARNLDKCNGADVDDNQKERLDAVESKLDTLIQPPVDKQEPEPNGAEHS